MVVMIVILFLLYFTNNYKMNDPNISNNNKNNNKKTCDGIIINDWNPPQHQPMTTITPQPQPRCFQDPTDWRRYTLDSTNNLGECRTNEEIFGACSRSATTCRRDGDIYGGIGYASPNYTAFNAQWNQIMTHLRDYLHPFSSNAIVYEANRAHVTLEYFCCTEVTHIDSATHLRNALQTFDWPTINITFSDHVGCIRYNTSYSDTTIHNTTYFVLVPNDETQDALFKVLRQLEHHLEQQNEGLCECRTGLFHATLLSINNLALAVAEEGGGGQDKNAATTTTTTTSAVDELHTKIASQWKSLNQQLGSFEVTVPS